MNELGTAERFATPLLAFARMCVAFLVLLVPIAHAANHPRVSSETNCAACHSDLLSGKTVHAEGELTCTLCHVVKSTGSYLTMSYPLPKEQLCFTCHERTAMQQHFPTPKRECQDCHDAHRSNRAILLKRDVETEGPSQSTEADQRSKSEGGTSRRPSAQK